MTTSLTDNGVQFADGSLLGAIPRSFLAGLTLSTAGTSATMSIAAGQATDSANAVAMTLAATSKTTAAWAVGTAAGGLDTGTIAVSTWYHFYVIRRPDTGVIDVLFSLSATAPTLPASYTQFRRIGSGLTNASSQWTKFIQYGDTVLWDTEVAEFNGNAPTAATLLTTTVPPNVVVEGIYILGGNPVAPLIVRVSSPSVSDQTPNQGNSQFIGNSAFTQQSEFRVFTNTSQQVRYRGSSANNVIMVTKGWVDTRGRVA